MNAPFPWLGHLIEVASLGLFGWCWTEARRLRTGLHAELLVAVVYGCLLEIMDMWIFGSYHYGSLTWWWVGHVPLYIPLLWATSIHSSMAMSDRVGLPWWARPFLDGLLAVLIDLAVDAIAIRLGLWSWRIRLDEGWFGVPAGNLCAWMWVAAWYGAVTRLVRERMVRRIGQPVWQGLSSSGLHRPHGEPQPSLCAGAVASEASTELPRRWGSGMVWVWGSRRSGRWSSSPPTPPATLVGYAWWYRLLIPPIAYAGLFASLVGMGAVGRWLGLETPDERLAIFAAHVAAFVAIVWWGSRRREASTVASMEATPMLSSFVWNRWLMHGSFLALLACAPAIRQVRGLALVSVVALVLEKYAMRWCERQRARGRDSRLVRLGTENAV